MFVWCVWKHLCVCFVCAEQLFQTIPLQPTSSPPPSFAVCVYVCPISERFKGKSSQVSLYFSISFLLQPRLNVIGACTVQQFVKPFVNSS